MQTRRKAGRWFQLEPMEGRVSLSGIGRPPLPSAPPAFGPVAPGSKPGGAGDGRHARIDAVEDGGFGSPGSKPGGARGDDLVPLTSGPAAPGSKPGGVGGDGLDG